MLIDWFTVIAQMINFLILVWLMKRFLYRPILNALDAREQRIAAQRIEAEAREAQAEAARLEFQGKTNAFEQQRVALFSRIEAEAEAERQRLREEARREADGLRQTLHDMLNSDFGKMHEELARKVGAEVLAIARKVLADLAGTELEAHMVEEFIRRLRRLDNDARSRMAATKRSSERFVLIRSAFKLAQPQRAAIEGAVRETIAAGIPLRFETLPDLLGGIELVMQGEKLSWSIADYLASLERDVDELLKAQHKPPPDAGRPDSRHERAS